MMGRDGVGAQVSSSSHVRDNSVMVANGVIGRNKGGFEEEAVGLSLLGGRDTPDSAASDGRVVENAARVGNEAK